MKLLKDYNELNESRYNLHYGSGEVGVPKINRGTLQTMVWALIRNEIDRDQTHEYGEYNEDGDPNTFIYDDKIMYINKKTNDIMANNLFDFLMNNVIVVKIFGEIHLIDKHNKVHEQSSRFNSSFELSETDRKNTFKEIIENIKR